MDSVFLINISAFILAVILIIITIVIIKSNQNKKYKKENILKLEQSDPVLYKSLVDNQYIVPDDFDELLKKKKNIKDEK